MDYKDDLRKSLAEGKLVLFACPAFDYNKGVMEGCNTLSGLFDRICFVAFLKPYGSWLKEFKDYNSRRAGFINVKRFFFVDGVEKIPEFQIKTAYPKYLMLPHLALQAIIGSMMGDHVFLYTRTDNNAINQRILSTVWDKRSQGLIVDSLTLLREYMGEDDIVRMMHMMTNRLRAFKCAGLFPFTPDKKDINLIKRIRPLFDQIVITK